MPEFPKALKLSLEKGDYNVQLMNDFLKAHVEAITVDSKINRQQYKTLAEQVTNRLKSMKLENADLYMVRYIENQLCTEGTLLLISIITTFF